MTVVVFHRRRAQRLARLLDEATGPGRHHAAAPDDDMAALVRLGRRLAAVPPVTEAPREDFRELLRARLVAKAELNGVARAGRPGTRTRVAAGTAAGPTWRPSRARGAILAGVAAGAVALSGVSTASNGAVPGDPLYGVKRSTEMAQLALAGNDISRGQMYLEFARIRLAEARVVRTDPQQFRAALVDMDAETRFGVRLLATAALERRDPAALDAIDTFTDGQRTDLFDMTRGLDSASVAGAVSSLALLDQVSRRVDQLRSSLSCQGAFGTRSDSLGPQPPVCQQGAIPPGGAKVHSPVGPVRSATGGPATSPPAAADPPAQAPATTVSAHAPGTAHRPASATPAVTAPPAATQATGRWPL